MGHSTEQIASPQLLMCDSYVKQSTRYLVRALGEDATVVTHADTGIKLHVL